MTIAAFHFAYCDSKRKDCPHGADAGTESEGTRSQLLGEMSLQGWVTRGRKHICPDCVAAESREGAP